MPSKDAAQGRIAPGGPPRDVPPRHDPIDLAFRMTDPNDAERAARRSRLIGRALIILLGLLVLAYVIPIFIHR